MGHKSYEINKFLFFFFFVGDFFITFAPEIEIVRSIMFRFIQNTNFCDDQNVTY